MILEGVPVWQFNSLQMRILMMRSIQKRKAEELRTLALMASTAGMHQEAMDCYLRSVELNNPETSRDKEDFAENAQAKFKSLMSMCKKSFADKSGKIKRPEVADEDFARLQDWVNRTET